MESLKEHAAALITGLLTLNAVGYGYIWRSLQNTLKEHSQDLRKYQENHFRCQAELPDKFATVKSFEQIMAKLEQFSDKINNLHVVYRTKEEANRDWRELEGRIAELKGLIETIGKTQDVNDNKLWDKLNRVVDEFRNSRNMLMERQGEIEKRVYTNKELFETNKKLREKLPAMIHNGHIEEET